jgi:methylmalonyl-CoA/ethylmalonyl-CoA epimerase
MSAPPVMHFDHLGIVVAALEGAVAELCAMLPISATTARFDDAGLGVSVQFLRDIGGTQFELIAPLGENSPVARIAKIRTNVLNQIAYRVGDLETAGRHLRGQGAVPTGRPAPAIAFGGARVQFYLTRHGFVIELIEAEHFRHQFEPFVAVPA